MKKNSRDFPNRFFLPKIPNQWEADLWCEENFGRRWSVVDNRSGTWCCFWRGTRVGENAGKYEWLFEHEHEAVLFLLRWS